MYQVQQYVDGRWWNIGTPFSTYEGASNKVMQYAQQGQQFGSKKHPGLKQPLFRVVRR